MLMLLGAALATGCSKDDDEYYTISNQEFVTQASSSNMFEIAAGTMAVQKSTNADVKAFGQHMMTDHGTAATEMANLANQKGWTIPSSMLQKHQANLNTLSGLSGAAFDKQFADMMVMSHQETITLFDMADNDNGVPDADLRSFASGKLPTLKHHLEEATQLKAKVNL